MVSTGSKEKPIVLTDWGKSFSEEILAPIFVAEEKAVGPFFKTMFVEQMEALVQRISAEFDQLKEEC